jgi:hypothetical protein
VEVLHRRLDVRVAHPLLDAAEVCLGDDPRAEGVAQGVEAKTPEPGSVHRGVVAASERGGVDVAAELTACATSGASGTERTLPELAVESLPLV